jgi:phage terminase Nu1 subunit (DNA packaging protein)
MKESSIHFKAFKEGTHRARLIKRDLRRALADSPPCPKTHNKHLKQLNQTYIDTLKEVIRQGDLFVDTTDNLELGLKVGITIENYRAFLSTLFNTDEIK